MSHALITIRGFRPGDLPFIMHSWLNNYVSSRACPFRSVAKGRIRAGHRPFVEQIVARAPVLVATIEDVDDSILGWVCAEAPGILHYVYVKEAHRNAGVGQLLLGAAAKRVGEFRYASHDTLGWHRYCHRRRIELAYSPGHAFYPPREADGSRTRPSDPARKKA